jgi:hypothetical protein
MARVVVLFAVELDMDPTVGIRHQRDAVVLHSVEPGLHLIGEIHGEELSLVRVGQLHIRDQGRILDRRCVFPGDGAFLPRGRDRVYAQLPRHRDLGHPHPHERLVDEHTGGHGRQVESHVTLGKLSAFRVAAYADEAHPAIVLFRSFRADESVVGQVRGVGEPYRSGQQQAR